jgi:hypothetical protein
LHKVVVAAWAATVLAKVSVVDAASMAAAAASGLTTRFLTVMRLVLSSGGDLLLPKELTEPDTDTCRVMPPPASMHMEAQHERSHTLPGQANTR